MLTVKSFEGSLKTASDWGDAVESLEWKFGSCDVVALSRAAAVAHSLHLWLVGRGSRVQLPVPPCTWSCWLLRCHLTCTNSWPKDATLRFQHQI